MMEVVAQDVQSFAMGISISADTGFKASPECTATSSSVATSLREARDLAASRSGYGERSLA